MAPDMDDDLDPRVLVELPETLQGMSIEELGDYIAELEAGIAPGPVAYPLPSKLTKKIL